jgi:competence protein ComEC
VREWDDTSVRAFCYPCVVPLITWAVFSYVAGLLAGSSPALALPALVACAGVVVASAVGALGAASPLVRRRWIAPAACALIAGTGVLVARDVRARDERCVAAGWQSSDWRAVRSPGPCDASAPDDPPGALDAWRLRAGARIDTLFGADAPLVRALLVADMRSVPPETRDRFADAGLIHILSISGLHVAIIAGAVLLGFEALRVPRSRARWAALGVTMAYVAAIGAPPPALRSASMLAVMTVSRSLNRPVSPWAVLAIGAAIPLLFDAHAVTDIGWQLSVAGFAALTAAGIWARRHIPPKWRGWRRALARDLAVSVLATVVTAPLVVWAFGRLSLVAPVTNIAASPVIALLQPMLFLALLAAPWRAGAQFVALAAHPVLFALDRIAAAGAAVPYGALHIAPSLGVTVAVGVAAASLLVAAASRPHAAGAALVCAALGTTVAIWWIAAPTGSGLMELHMIDVGQGDAVAVRTPRGRWLLVDAGREWPGGDAGRTTVVPYLRRFGGDLALFVLSHPHADHVGGAATVLRALHPMAYRDGAFAGGSEPYMRSLTAAGALGIRWSRVHPGDSLTVDGVSVTFLAPDSSWTAQLHDPNLASTVALVQYGEVRLLLTGDAEAPEEAWLLAHARSELHADVLKVGHHGSSTSSSAEFLDAVHARVALVSVGAGNAYGHPSSDVMRDLAARGATVLRTDQLGTVVVRTDGHSLRIEAAARNWTLAPR